MTENKKEEFKPRNIVKVINQIKEKIPSSESDLLGRLDWIINNASYRAPELMYICWQFLGEALHNFLGETPSEEWHWEVVSIFTTIPIKNLKRDLIRG